MLASSFFELSTYAQQAVKRALTPPVSQPPDPHSSLSADSAKSTQFIPPAELDVMLPKACEALVLLAQCIVTITLESDQQKHHEGSEPNLKAFFNETRSSGQGLAESLIGKFALHQLYALM